MGLLRMASKTILGFNILCFLLLAFAFVFARPESGAYVIAQVTLVPLTLTTIGAVVIIRTGWDPL